MYTVHVHTCIYIYIRMYVYVHIHLHVHVCAHTVHVHVVYKCMICWVSMCVEGFLWFIAIVTDCLRTWLLWAMGCHDLDTKTHSGPIPRLRRHTVGGMECGRKPFCVITSKWDHSVLGPGQSGESLLNSETTW